MHAPNGDKDEMEKLLSYATLEDVFNPSEGKDKLLLGEFNAKIGRKQCYRNTVGIYNLHATSNDNSSKLIEI